MGSDFILSPEARHELLRDFPLVVRLPVQWGEQDAFGHVNNLSYLRWCETARIEYLDRIGLWRLKEETGVGPIVASVQCDYRRPVVFPDTVQVGARVVSIGNTSFRMVHRVYSERLEVTAADADSTMVVLDYNTNIPVPVPEDVRRAIAALEGHEIDT